MLFISSQIAHVHIRELYGVLSARSINDIKDMFNLGLFINDLSMHDFSRDMVLAGSQQQAELKLALDQVLAALLFPSACFSV